MCFAVTGMGNFEGSAAVSFEITKLPVEIPAGITGLTYNGSEQVGVMEGEGYELSGVASATNAGDYIAIVTLANGYIWSDGSSSRVEIEWSIEPADIVSANIAAIPAQAWTGSAIEPELMITFNGTALVEGRNYIVAYTNNVNSGTAKATVTGIGNFTGTVEVSFEVLQKARWEEGPGGWKYKNSDGTYSTNCWQEIDGVRYHFGSNGYMQTGWLYDAGEWYYLKASGAMACSEWVKVSGSWYHFASDGVMQTGWLYDAGEWYYLEASGAMACSEWVKVSGSWYYFDGSGAMQASKWIGNYYVLADGKMATSQWVGPYYVGADGEWVPGYAA